MMTNFIDTLDGIENLFLSNLCRISALAGTLIELDALIEKSNDDASLGLLNA